MKFHMPSLCYYLLLGVIICLQIPILWLCKNTTIRDDEEFDLNSKSIQVCSTFSFIFHFFLIGIILYYMKQKKIKPRLFDSTQLIFVVLFIVFLLQILQISFAFSTPKSNLIDQLVVTPSNKQSEQQQKLKIAETVQDRQSSLYRVFVVGILGLIVLFLVSIIFVKWKNPLISYSDEDDNNNDETEEQIMKQKQIEKALQNSPDRFVHLASSNQIEYWKNVQKEQYAKHIEQTKKYKNDIEKYKKELNQIKLDYSTLQKQIEQNQQFLQSQPDWEAKFNVLQNQHEAYVNENQSNINETIKSLEKQRDLLQSQLTKKENEFNAKENDWRIQRQEFQLSIVKLNDKIKELESSNKQTSLKSDEHKKAITEVQSILLNHNQIKTKEIEELNIRHNSELSKLNNEIKILQNDIQKQKNNIDKLTAELKNENAKVQKSQNEKFQLELKIQALSSELNKFNKDPSFVESLDQDVKNYTKLKRDYETIKAELDKYDGLQARFEQCEQKHTSCEEKFKNLMKEVKSQAKLQGDKLTNIDDSDTDPDLIEDRKLNAVIMKTFGEQNIQDNENDEKQKDEEENSDKDAKTDE